MSASINLNSSLLYEIFFSYHIDRSVLPGTIPLVKCINHNIRLQPQAGANCLYVTLALVPYLQMVRRFPPSPISLGKLGLLFGIMAAAEGGFLSLSENEVLTVLPENMEKNM